MTRVIPRFDTLAAAKYTPALGADGGEEKKRIDLEEVFGENLFGLHQM